MNTSTILINFAKFSQTAVLWGSRSYRCLRIYALFDAAIGNLVVLETLRHGTCLSNYLLIQLRGADPNAGATRHGSITFAEQDGNQKSDYRTDCEGHFFVTKDSKANCEHSPEIRKRLIPIIYVFQSSMSAWRYPGLSRFVQHPLWSIGIALGLLHPTLKFRYALNEIPSVFEEAPGMPEEAYRTPERLPLHRLGVTGSLYHGVNSRWFSRARTRPFMPLLGAIQFFVAIGLLGQLAGIGPAMPLCHSSSKAIRWIAKTVRFLALQPVHISAW